MMLRVRSRDGLERVSIENPQITVWQLKTLIQSQLQIPIQNQTLSTNQNLLLAKTPSDLLKFTDMSNTVKYFSDYFLECNQTQEKKLFSLKSFTFANILRWKIIYSETNGA
jgi:hypothetical protein